MKKTVKRTMYYPTFNTKTNEFDYEEITHERAMTEQEQKWEKIMDASLWMWIGLTALSLIAFVIGVVVDMASFGIASVIIFFICSVGGCVTNNFIIEPQYDKVFANSETFGFEAEILKWEQICQEQNIIAQEWRAEHEFEELIRKAKLSANCNDIAKAAIYYANHYIKGE